MLPRPIKRGVTNSQAFQAMISYLLLIEVPFKAEYDEDKGQLKYIRIRRYTQYDEALIKDIKGMCLQLYGCFTEGDVGEIAPYLDLEWY